MGEAMNRTNRKQWDVWFCAIIFLLSWLFFAQALSFAVGGNLVYNGDFEMVSSRNPPPGWEVWAARENISNYFLRETTNPHGGKACLRIYHPPRTAGYLVSSPGNAIQAKKGKIYTLSFWARTDKPGVSSAGFIAYEKINPFVDAPAPTYNIEVGRDWKKYSFEIREGFDLSAEKSRFLMLVFKATLNLEEEKNLWIDDVVVSEQDNPKASGLIDEKSISYKPLAHRLTPGSSLNVNLDVNKRIGPTNREIGGISFHRVTGHTGQPFNRQGQYTLSPEMERAIRDLHLPMTRFFALGDEPFGFEGAIERVAEVCKRTGIPINRTVLEGEPYNRKNILTPEAWARAVRFAVQKGYPFQYWEITNEPDVSSRQGKNVAISTPDEYVDHLKAVSKAIRKVQPKAQIGIPIADSPHWGSYLLKQAAGYYDFAVGHWYSFGNVHRRTFEMITLTDNYKIMDKILRFNELLRLYNPGREVPQIDTEWGLHSSGPNGEAADGVERNGNIYGTIHRAVRLIYYAREGMLKRASSWNLLSHANEPGFGILTQEAENKRFLLYWLYYYFHRHLGESILDLSGTAPYYYPPQGEDAAFMGPITPVLATRSKDGKVIYLIVANGSWERTVPCRINLVNYHPVRAEGILLSHSDPNGKALLTFKEEAISNLSVSINKQEVICTMPPHSVSFITLKNK